MPRLPSALGERDFRLFWAGHALSTFGSQFTTVAVAWQMYEITNSPLQVGLLGLARAAPQMGLMLFGGLLADSVDRRRLLMLMQVCQFVVSAALTMVAFAGAMSPAVLYVGSVLLAVCTALGMPARQAYLPNLVPQEMLGNALAFNNTSQQLSNIVGPAVAGVTLAVAGAASCYAVDAVSWLAMLVMLAGIRRRAADAPRGRVTLGSLGEGFAFLRTQPLLIALIVLDSGASFFGEPRALLPIFARDLFFSGPEGLGLLYGASSFGSFVTALFLGLRGQPRAVGMWVLLGLAFYGLGAMLFAATPRLAYGFALGMLLLACMGAGDTMNSILRQSINQLLTPDSVRGRVTSVSSLFTTAGPQLGQVESGVTASWWGAERAMFVGGLMTILFVVGVARVPGLVRFGTAPRAEAEPGRR